MAQFHHLMSLVRNFSPQNLLRVKEHLPLPKVNPLPCYWGLILQYYFS